MRHACLLMAAFCLLIAPAAAQEFFIDVAPVRGGVIYIRAQSPMGNQASVLFPGAQGSFLADANIKEILPLIVGKVAELHAGRIRYVATTHQHGDHTQGLELLDAGLVTIAPDQQRLRLATLPLMDDESPSLIAAALPKATFSDSMTLHIDDETIRIFTPPAKNSHTDGDAFVHFQNANVLYVGDHYFYDKFPLIDLDGGGDLDGYFANLDWIAAAFPPETIVLPGHGSFHPTPVALPTNIEFGAWVAKVKSSVAIVRAAFNSGESADALVAAGLGAEFDAMETRPRYQSEERWIRFLYAAFERESGAR